MYNSVEVYMFHSPFGSIFSDADTPGGKAKAEAQKPAKAEAQKPAKAKASPAKAALKLPAKKPFSVLPPQFKVNITTMSSDDPKVKVEHSKILVEKNKQKLAAVSRRLGDMKNKIKSAKIYRDVLARYIQLGPQDKKALDGWVLIHAQAIKKLNSARKLKGISKTNREAIKALDAEIRHWENLAKLKKGGANLQGKAIIKDAHPTGLVAAKEKLPVFKAKADTKGIGIVRLSNKSSRGSELRGLDASDEAIRNIFKNKPRYTEKFINKLPPANASFLRQEARRAPGLLERKSENTMILAKQYQWKIDRVLAEMEDVSIDYKKVQDNLKGLISGLKDQQSINTSTALGILLEARPGRFLSEPTILQSSMAAFTRLSTLGDTDQSASPDIEADQLLAEASEESAASLKELETRQHALSTIKAEVEGKPAPAPIRISVEVITPAPQKTKVKPVSFINKALPWIAGALLLKTLLEK